MKQTVQTFAAAFAAISIATSAHAAVVAPTASIKEAYGTILVEGVEFQTKITDSGWRTSGQLYPAPKTIEATKNFFIDYTATQDSRGLYDTHVARALYVDAQEKCFALGQQEYPGQVKDLPANWKSNYTAKIVTDHVDAQSQYAWGVFNCQVRVNATE